MELLYIYLNNYRGVFKEQQFNFSSELRFKYNKASRELRVERNDQYLPQFFQIGNERDPEHGKIVNVTGIIGKNGAGKTTILEYIKENLVEGAGGLLDKAIIIMRNEKGRGKIFVHSDLRIEKGNFYDFDFEEPYYYEENADKMLQLFTSVISDTTVVFYSNIFDVRQELEWAGMRNISTNYLVKHYKHDIKEMNEDFLISETELYRLEEIRKQLHFIYSTRNELQYLPFKLPDHVIVTTRSTRFDIQAVDPKNKRKKDNSNFNYIIRHLVNSHSEQNWTDKVKKHFWVSLLDTFFQELQEMNLELVLDETVLNYAYNEEDSLYKKLTLVLQTMIQGIKNNKYSYDALWRWFDCIKQLLDFFEVHITKDTVSHVDYSFVIPLNGSENESESPLKKLLDLHVEVARLFPLLDFNWGDLSSGEKAFLSCYARFYALADNQQIASNMHLERNVLILIDEGELYLHPEWQKSFLYNLIRYLPSIYTNRNIQIILTSNSPIIVSDLPKANLIFIDKGENGSQVIDGLQETKQTFAANIHTLFADAFFIKTGLIGEFANQVLLSLINTINETPSPELFERRVVLESLIGQIGEPILRTKISSMLKNKIHDYVDSTQGNRQLLETIRKMQIEIEELKRGKGNDFN
ncbi:AAA family ATPase [Paenibacillus sp. TH7-28]